MSSVWDGSRTLAKVQEAYDKRLISPELYNSHMTGLQRKSLPSEPEIFSARVENRNAVVAQRAGRITLEEAHAILHKNVALGFTGGKEGSAYFDELVKTDEVNKKKLDDKILDEGLRFLSRFIVRDRNEFGGWEFNISEDKKGEQLLAEEEGQELFHIGCEKLIEEDGYLDRTKAGELKVAIGRRMREKMNVSKSEDFFPQDTKQKQVLKISTRAEFDAAPSGSELVDTRTGKRYRKP